MAIADHSGREWSFKGLTQSDKMATKLNEQEITVWESGFSDYVRKQDSGVKNWPQQIIEISKPCIVQG